MKSLQFCCILFFCSVFSLLSIACASKEVVTEHVTVVYSNPDHLAYAKRVAYEAEQALDKLIPLFRWEPRLITLTVDTDSGFLYGRATPFPHPYVNLGGTETAELVGFEYRSTNLIYALVMHELFHVMQTSYSNPDLSEDITTSPDANLIDWQIAPLVPTWFVEGIASWSESYGTEQYSLGGSNSARVNGIVETIALADAMPSFQKVGANHNGYNINTWPNQFFPYDLGGAFSYYLVETYGFDAILETLTEYNQLGFWGGFTTDFATAWHTTQGSYLEDIWIEWQALLKAKAEARAKTLAQGKQLTFSGGETFNPVISPDGTKIAWFNYNSLWLAQVDGTSIHHPRNIAYGNGKFAWFDNHHIVYVEGNKLVKLNIHAENTDRHPANSLSLRPYIENDIKETQRSFGRLQFGDIMPQGCILLVQNGVYAQADELWRWCDGTGGKVDIWQMPENVDVINATVSSEGQIALSLWQAGFADIALFDIETQSLNYLTQDTGEDLEPVWSGEDSLIFRSDRHRDTSQDNKPDNNAGLKSSAVFDLYRLDISDTPTVTRLSRTLGGAFTPSVHEETIWYSTLGHKGYNISVLDSAEILSESESVIKGTLPESIIDIPEYEVRNYQAGSSLLPHALLPEFLKPNNALTDFNFPSLSSKIGVVLLGNDRALKEGYVIGAGYQYNPDDTSNVASDVASEDFESHWYGYLEYSHNDRFGKVFGKGYDISNNFKVSIGQTTTIESETNTATTFDITDNFNLTPSMSSSLYWFNDNSNTDFRVSLSPTLFANYQSHFNNTRLNLGSTLGLSYRLYSFYSTVTVDGELTSVEDLYQSQFGIFNGYSFGLSKDFVSDISIWQTHLSLYSQIDYETDLDLSVYWYGNAIVNRPNLDNWSFDAFLNFDTSSTTPIYSTYRTGLNFSNVLDADTVGLSTEAYLSYNSDLEFSLDLDSFYALSDLFTARASLDTRSQFAVRNTYSPETDEYSESQIETINSLASFSLHNYDFEGLELTLQYLHPIIWFYSSTGDSSLRNPNNYNDQYDDTRYYDDRYYTSGLDQPAQLSFRINSLHLPTYESSPWRAALTIGIDNLYEDPLPFTNTFVSYYFNNSTLKDRLALNLHLSGGQDPQSYIGLNYSASLPPLLTWDGKYGFQSIYATSGIDYDFANESSSAYLDFQFNTVLSYQWNLWFGLGIEYQDGELYLKLY